MIDKLKENISIEREIISKMRVLQRQLIVASGNQRDVYIRSFDSLKHQLKILNDSVPALLNEIISAKNFNSGYGVEKKEINKNIVSVGVSEKDEKYVIINKEDKEKFRRELGVSAINFRKLKKLQSVKTGERKPSQLARISNKIFSSFSDSIAGRFSSVKDDLRRANIRFSISTYLSIAIFVSIMVLVLSLVGWGVLVFLGFASLFQIWIPFVLVFICLGGFYFYPASEKGSVGKRIADELPFVTIHMAAIAGSNIEPTRIFRIIANSPEYPTVGLEMNKIVNQVEVYGYDLVSALRNATKSTPNQRLADLFSGLSTNIVSGGDLKDYLEKKAENFLSDYKRERNKYTQLAETFMDIYISVMITAPLILVVMLIIMNVTGLSIGLPFIWVMVLIIGLVVLINIIFLVALEVKQPRV